MFVQIVQRVDIEAEVFSGHFLMFVAEKSDMVMKQGDRVRCGCQDPPLTSQIIEVLREHQYGSLSSL